MEFKSTLRVDLGTGKEAKYIVHASLKTVAAFLNTDGGTLVIGVADDGKTVSDDGEPLGLYKDKFKNEDEMKLNLTARVKDEMTLGAVAIARGLVHMKFYDYRGSRVLAVRCEPAAQPIYVRDYKDRKDRSKLQFYVRTGPATQEFFAQQTVEYSRDRFPA